MHTQTQSAMDRLSNSQMGYDAKLNLMVMSTKIHFVYCKEMVVVGIIFNRLNNPPCFVIIMTTMPLVIYLIL